MCQPEHQSGAGHEHLQPHTIGRLGYQRYRGRRHRVPHSRDRGMLVLAVFDIDTLRVIGLLKLKFLISMFQKKSKTCLDGSL